MTTTVIVKAHCAKEKEVLINRFDEFTGEQIVIQDGQEWSGVVYDDKTISVTERLKAAE